MCVHEISALETQLAPPPTTLPLAAGETNSGAKKSQLLSSHGTKAFRGELPSHPVLASLFCGVRFADVTLNGVADTKERLGPL